MPRCYANPLPTFQLAMRLIASITQANPAVITTTFAHNYITGAIVRLNIPSACGMQQANGQTGTIVVLSPTTFAINIDTSMYDAFSIPGSPTPLQDICAQVIPIGEINDILTAATQNVLPLP